MWLFLSLYRVPTRLTEKSGKKRHNCVRENRRKKGRESPKARGRRSGRATSGVCGKQRRRLQELREGRKSQKSMRGGDPGVRHPRKKSQKQGWGTGRSFAIPFLRVQLIVRRIRQLPKKKKRKKARGKGKDGGEENFETQTNFNVPLKYHELKPHSGEESKSGPRSVPWRNSEPNLKWGMRRREVFSRKGERERGKKGTRQAVPGEGYVLDQRTQLVKRFYIFSEERARRSLGSKSFALAIKIESRRANGGEE